MFALPRRTVGSLLILMSLVLLAAGWQATSEMRRFLRVAERTTGEVVGHEAFDRQARTPREQFRIVVSYETATGTRVRFRTVTGFGRPPYDVGERVPVLYNPEDPFEARVDSKMDTVVPLVIWGGAVLLVAGLGAAVALWGPAGNGRR